MSANGTRRRGASAPGAALLALWLALPPCALAAEPPTQVEGGASPASCTALKQAPYARAA